jgi:predicted amidophosphoribosyltransferase
VAVWPHGKTEYETEFHTMCWYCGSPVTDEEPFGRSLLCDVCGKDLRSCRNCKFFVSGARGDCRETSAEPVAEKETANFCDWFSFNSAYRVATAGNKNDMEKTKAARTAFDNLFK